MPETAAEKRLPGADGGRRREIIYFYYLNPRQKDGSLDAYCVEKTVSRMTLATVEELVDKAENGALPHRGKHISELPWKDPGYVVFACRDNDIALDNVTFHLDHERGPNISFGRARKFSFDKNVTAISRRNKRINRNGNPLGDEEEVYHVNFKFRPRGGVQRLHEETGTNTGP